MDASRARLLTQASLAGTRKGEERRGLALRALGERLEEAGPNLYGERLQQATQHSVTAAAAHIEILTGLDTDEALIVARAFMQRLL